MGRARGRCGRWLGVVLLAGCGRIGFDTVLFASAGPDQQVDFVGSPTGVCVDPSDSFDPEGAIASCVLHPDAGSTIGSGSCVSRLCFQAYLPGIYPVQMVVTDADGNVAVDEATITLIAPGHPPPSDGLTRFDCGPDQSVAKGDPVAFDFAASWNADGRNFRQYDHDFGDGTMAGGTALVATHTYEAPGTFTVIYHLENVMIPIEQWPVATTTITVN